MDRPSLTAIRRDLVRAGLPENTRLKPSRFESGEAWKSKIVDLRPNETFLLHAFLELSEWEGGKIKRIISGEVGIERSEYPEGYGFLRFWHKTLPQAPVLEIKYDITRRFVTQVSARSHHAKKVKESLMPLIDEETETVRACFHILGLRPQVSAWEESEHERFSRQSEERQCLLASFIVPAADIRFGFQTDVSPGAYVDQGEYAGAAYSEHIRTLRTGGIGYCVALILYDQETKTGALFHIDIPGEDNRKIKSPIYNAIAFMERAGAKNIRAFLVGGNSWYSRVTILGIQQSLPERVKILGMSILQMHPFENVVLDLGTGQLSRYPENADRGLSGHILLRDEAEAHLNNPYYPLRFVRATL